MSGERSIVVQSTFSRGTTTVGPSPVDVHQIPSGTPLRSQIALELKAMIGERLARGQSMEEVLRQLGDPASLAESYLSAEPLEAAAFWPRAAAKVVDFFIVASVLAVPFVSRRMGLHSNVSVGVPELILLVLIVISPLYTVLSEYWAGGGESAEDCPLPDGRLNVDWPNRV